ncbi:MAG TPA: SDR family NAD(P)-dependent oxidoreductase [Acidobacteriota bacterium]|nr:SDR family NAD(P)-dependent oxidoreductase [Acidobacteriota bacterium]
MPTAGERTCVITGATSEIGLETVRQLAARGQRVIGLGQDLEECRRAGETLRQAGRLAGVRFIAADLASIKNVRRAAAAVRKALPGGRLDRLIHNATAFSDSYLATEDGYERQFAVNYLAAFLLTRELWPSLVRPAEARIIAVSSASHRKAEIAWDDIMSRRRYSGLRAFRQSKLALVLFAAELNRRVARRFPLRAIGIEPRLADPGNTRPGGLSAVDAAWSIVRLVTDPPAAVPRDYWRLGRPAEPGPNARNAEAALRLWRLSEELTGADFL